MSILDPRGSEHMLGALYPARAPSLEHRAMAHALTARVWHTVLVPIPSRPDVLPGMHRPLLRTGTARQCEDRSCCPDVVPLSTSWWRRALAWFVAPAMPEARARER